MMESANPTGYSSRKRVLLDDGKMNKVGLNCGMKGGRGREERMKGGGGNGNEKGIWHLNG